MRNSVPPGQHSKTNKQPKRKKKKTSLRAKRERLGSARIILFVDQLSSLLHCAELLLLWSFFIQYFGPAGKGGNASRTTDLPSSFISPLLGKELLEIRSLTAERMGRVGTVPSRFGLPILCRGTLYRALGRRVAVLTANPRGKRDKNVAQDIETHR